jgi:hypothetical protein
MNYEKYYLDQAGGLSNDYNVYRGRSFQKGFGIGGMFRKFFKWIVPIVRKVGSPLLESGAQALGTEIVNSGSKFANDVFRGRNVNESLKENFSNSVDNLKSKIEKKFYGTGIKGVVKRRKKAKYIILKKKKQKPSLDIFE